MADEEDEEVILGDAAAEDDDVAADGCIASSVSFTGSYHLK